MTWLAFPDAACQNYVKLECHPCIVGIWSILDNTGRQSHSEALLSLLTEHTRVVSTSVVGESIAAERDVRIEGNGG